MKPKSLSTDDYLEILIKTEEEEKRPGFEERIAGLKKIKQDNLVLKKIEQNEDLLETVPPHDAENDNVNDNDESC